VWRIHPRSSIAIWRGGEKWVILTCRVESGGMEEVLKGGSEGLRGTPEGPGGGLRRGSC